MSEPVRELGAPVVQAQGALRAAVRRVRLEAAVALAEQQGLPPDACARLEAKLGSALREERSLRDAAGPEDRVSRLIARLRLRAGDERILLACVALELDPTFAITASALAGEEPRHGISAKLCAQIFRLAADDGLGLGLGLDHPLARSAVLESGAAASMPDALRPWRVTRRVIAHLGGADELDPVLRRVAELVPVPDDDDPGGDAREILDRSFAAGDDVILCVEGIEGVGRRTVVARAAAAIGRQVVALDLGRVSNERDRFVAELRALRRECWLRGAVPLIARIDAIASTDPRRAELMAEVAEALEADGVPGGVAVVTAYPGAALPELRRRVVRVRVDGPTPAERTEMWRRSLAGTTMAPGYDLAAVVQGFALTPGGLQRAAANVRMMAAGEPLTPEHLRAGVAAEVAERFHGLATRVAISQSWDDLVLPQDTLDEVKAFVSRAAHSAKVYDEWGFRTKLQRGLGLAALFSGPPGTGKTMVAGLIARSLGLELYMVELSQVVSKWIGETEKHLGRIFDAASMGNVVLLFDEADSLFSKRTEVKSSNDRYANLEVNYLLQRLEQFSGIAILTTNAETSVDQAFKRRLSSHVVFFAPDTVERERLWRTVLPPDAPVEPGLEFDALAHRFKDMCGGHIRNAVLRAAFLAASESSVITQEHLQRAAVGEYRAMGKVV